MDNSRFQLIIPASYLLFLACTAPTMGNEREPVLRAATNGTIGPKSRIEMPLETGIKSYRVPTVQDLRRIEPELALTSKLRIETPLEKSLNPRSYSSSYGKSSKSRIENSLERTLDPGWRNINSELDATRSVPVHSGWSNAVGENNKERRERPGLISWHPNLEEALSASSRSGKPVLLVHILGNLNDHFC